MTVTSFTLVQHLIIISKFVCYFQSCLVVFFQYPEMKSHVRRLISDQRHEVCSPLYWKYGHFLRMLILCYVFTPKTEKPRQQCSIIHIASTNECQKCYPHVRWRLESALIKAKWLKALEHIKVSLVNLCKVSKSIVSPQNGMPDHQKVPLPPPPPPHLLPGLVVRLSWRVFITHFNSLREESLQCLIQTQTDPCRSQTCIFWCEFQWTNFKSTVSFCNSHLLLLWYCQAFNLNHVLFVEKSSACPNQGS